MLAATLYWSALRALHIPQGAAGEVLRPPDLLKFLVSLCASTL